MTDAHSGGPGKRRGKEQPGPGARPTLKTISEITGLGVTTVSRALKDGPELSAETRARVKSVAADIGYRPNRAGVRLRTGRTYVIGLILDQSVAFAEFERSILLGVSNVLAETNYHVVVMPTPNQDDILEPVRYFVETAAADGLIFTHTRPQDERVPYLTNLGFPFVTHGRTELGIEHAFCDFDNERFMVEAVGRLVERGRRRLAVIAPSETHTCAHHMFAGFAKASRATGVEGIIVEGIDLDSDPLEFRKVASEIASGPNAPDGFICANETRCIALMAGLRDVGRVIGDDVDVIAKDTTDILDHITPGVDSFFEDISFAGKEMARLLLKRLDGAPVSELQSIAEPVFHPRA